MLIREFTESPDLQDVDLIDDLEFFIKNDDKFYRRTFWPTLSKLKSDIKSGKGADSNCFRNCVDQAALLYCKKFNIADNPKSVFTDVDRDSLAKKIFDNERTNIEKGTYDRSAE